MGAIRFHTTSHKPLEEFRREMDRAIHRSKVAHMLRHTWKDGTMTIAGPGSHGVLHYRDGRVHGEIRISFPATMIRDRIVADIRHMLESAGGGKVAVTS